MPSLEFLSKFECHGSIRLKTQSNLHFIRHYFLSLSPPFVLFPQSVVLVSCVVNQFKKLDGYRALRNKSRKEENVETCGAKIGKRERGSCSSVEKCPFRVIAILEG